MREWEARAQVVGAAATAVLLAVAGVLLVVGADSIRGRDGGEDTRTASPTSAPATTVAPAPTTTAPPATTTTAAPTTTVRPPGEVRVRVANGAGRSGLAGAGGDLLRASGYVVDISNAAGRPTSVVYHAPGFAAEAAQVAVALGMAETAVAPIPDAPEASVDGVDLLAVLGADTTVG